MKYLNTMYNAMKQKYKDFSNGEFPKTLMIRNHEGGMIWQVYHVTNQKQVDILIKNSWGNGFYGSTLENHQLDYEETFLDWRETCSDKLKSAL